MSRVSRDRHDGAQKRRNGCPTLTWFPSFSIQEDGLKSLTSPARRSLSLLRFLHHGGWCFSTPSHSSFNTPWSNSTQPGNGTSSSK